MSKKKCNSYSCMEVCLGVAIQHQTSDRNKLIYQFQHWNNDRRRKKLTLCAEVNEIRELIYWE